MTSIATMAVAAPIGGAAVASQKPDPTAMIRIGAPINDNGGVFFDPSKDTQRNVYSPLMMDLIYDTLIRRNQKGKLLPSLATKWEMPDPNTVVLTLDKGRKFTDGTPFNAAAVKAAIERQLAWSTNPVASTPPEVKTITSVETPDEYTVKINMNAPNADTMVRDIMTRGFYLGIPSPTAAATGTLNQKPVGAGPYMVQNYTPGGDVTMVKNPDYPDKKFQKAGGFVWTQLPQGPPQNNALMAGTVDLIIAPPPDSYQALDNAPGVTLTSRPGSRVYHMGFCTSRGPLANKTARQAINLALNRAELNAGALAGAGVPAGQVVAPTDQYYNDEYDVPEEGNPKQAKKLWQQAGIAPGTKLTLVVNSDPLQATLADIVQAQIKETLGVDVEVTKTANYASDVTRLQPDIANGYLEPTLYSIAFQTQSPLNQCNWRSADLDTALSNGKNGALPKGQRQAAWDDFAEILQDEAPVVPMVVAPLVVAHRDDISGIDYPTSILGPQLDVVYKAKSK